MGGWDYRCVDGWLLPFGIGNIPFGVVRVALSGGCLSVRGVG